MYFDRCSHNVRSSYWYSQTVLKWHSACEEHISHLYFETVQEINGWNHERRDVDELCVHLQALELLAGKGI
jgi:hypothetical protein